MSCTFPTLSNRNVTLHDKIVFEAKIHIPDISPWWSDFKSIYSILQLLPSSEQSHIRKKPASSWQTLWCVTMMIYFLTKTQNLIYFSQKPNKLQWHMRKLFWVFASCVAMLHDNTLLLDGVVIVQVTTGVVGCVFDEGRRPFTFTPKQQTLIITGNVPTRVYYHEYSNGRNCQNVPYMQLVGRSMSSCHEAKMLSPAMFTLYESVWFIFCKTFSTLPLLLFPLLSLTCMAWCTGVGSF